MTDGVEGVSPSPADVGAEAGLPPQQPIIEQLPATPEPAPLPPVLDAQPVAAPPEAAPVTPPPADPDTRTEAATTVPETAVVPEVARETQQREINAVATTLINKRTSEAVAKREDNQILSKGEGYLADVYDAQEFINGVVFKDASNQRVMEMELSGNPIMVEYDGQERRVRKVKIDKDNNVKYEIEVKGATAEDDTYPDVELPQEAFLQAYLNSEKQAISEVFTDSDRKVVELDFKLKSGDTEALTTEDPTQLNAAIEKAAQSAGRVTTGDAIALVKALYPGNSELVTKARGFLKNKALLDGETLMAIVALDGDSQTQFSQEAVSTFAELLNNGNTDPEKMKIIRDAVQSGNIDTIAQVLIIESPNDTDEQKAEIDRKRQMLKDIAKGTGIGLGIALLYMINAMAQSATKV